LASKRALVVVTAGLLLAPLATAPTPAAAEPAAGSILAKLTPTGYTPAGCNVEPTAKDTARCFALVVDAASAGRLAPDAAGPAATALGPADIKAAYRLPDGGQGQTVAIVDAYGNSHVEDDLATFRAHYGLPPCTTANGCFRKVDQSGGTDFPPDDAGWGLETSLDVDAVSAACPACHILLVQGNSASLNDLATAVDTAAALGAKFISNSYGLSTETATETAYDSHYSRPGIVVTAASGDTGNHQIWPAANPDVVAVGGTRLTPDTSTARGWTESAWSSGGSGCSPYEPQPAFQAGIDTDCPRRAVADISAVADPASGLAVYDTLGYDGWRQVGGTSLSAPLVAAMYALAGPPVAGTFPVSYPYLDQGNGLFDITAGSNGTCGGVLCTAGAGWDGPTGLGTPDGVDALGFGPHGTINGQVTDQAGGGPHGGVSLTMADASTGRVYHATTDDQGRYSTAVGVGSYDVSASAFGYVSGTRADLAITDGATATVDLTLAKVPTRRVSGTVTDASGHGWPLATKITIDGYPNGAIATDPFTGAYSVDLPQNATYAMRAVPDYAGYQDVSAQLTVGGTDQRKDFAIGVDPADCTAAGYAYPAGADFEDWTGRTPKPGWTVVDRATTGLAWQFDDQQINITGGAGNYAAADPFDNGGTAIDSDLVTPVVDLTDQSARLQFDAAYAGFGNDSIARADVSADAGKTWTPVWSPPSGSDYLGHVDVAIPQSATVQVRFHFAGQGATLLEVDNVRIGRCGTVPGGLVAGTVSDANTGDPVSGAVVTDQAVSAATDAAGFYWLFSTPAGKHTYTTTAARYATRTSTARTVPDAVTRQNLPLRAGQLQVSPGALAVTGTLGKSVTRELRLTNTGRAPLHVTFAEQGDTPDPGTGAPLIQTPGEVPTGARATGPPPVAGTVQPGAAGAAWTSIADYPQPIMDNASGYYRGKTYSVGGIDTIWAGTVTAHGYVYDPAAGTWAPIADLPQPRQAPAAAFLNGTMYVVGGWDSTTVEQSTVYAYHPADNTWTRAADLPVATATANIATLDGKLYIIGGCLPGCNTTSSAVYRYDPATNKWTRLADYPHVARWGACAGLAGEVVCAGGLWNDPHANSLASTYRYHPATDAWAKAADMPMPDWGAVYSGANGKLQLLGGAAGTSSTGGSTNQVIQYDPVADVWAQLPNANFQVLRGAGGCGMYRVAGWTSVFYSVGSTTSEVLPGLDQCEGDEVSWLSVNKAGVDLAPGRSARVRVTLDASKVAQSGLYTATLTANTDTPYDGRRVEVSFQVAPPKGTSTVTGTATDAVTRRPIAGATVRVCASRSDAPGSACAATYTVRTDAQGRYEVQVAGGLRFATVATEARHYRPESRLIRLGTWTVADFALRKSS